jgi:hypothetical protein
VAGLEAGPLVRTATGRLPLAATAGCLAMTTGTSAPKALCRMRGTLALNYLMKTHCWKLPKKEMNE